MHVLAFKPARSPIKDRITKFGGQPVWITEPMWPVSRSTGLLMRFICQVSLPPELRHGSQEMAYIFMTDIDVFVEGTWLAVGGENAVILQPGPFEGIVETTPAKKGPTLQVRQPPRRGILAAILGNKKPRFVDAELSVTQIEVNGQDKSNSCHSRLGGRPVWLQNDDTPTDGSWDLIIQIDSCEKAFDVNFGDAGIGYAFIRRDGGAGRFLWQCA